MKKIFTYTALFIACIIQATAQQNCSNPLVVTLCPATTLTGQTNLGMLNDFTSSCNLAGEDLVYKMTTRPGTTQIYINFSSVSSLMRATLTTNCGYTGCSSYNVYSGTSNFLFNVSGNTNYYLWIDASTTVTYNISIGYDTSYTYINIPNTQGNLGFETSLCATPPFKPTKPELQVKYNGIYQTDPMTLSPLNVPGTLCVINYFKNTTGVEGLKRFDFYYNPLGFSSFTPSQMTFPGFYNPGNWVGSLVGPKWSFLFVDSAGLGRGDFTGTPNTCLRYEFCFNVTPISNDPVKTNVKDSAFSDGFGAGFAGWVHAGCCPIGYANCLGTGPGGGGGGTGHAFGASFADPGVLLPIVLLQFNAKPKNENVEVEWITSSELNNDFFTIEKSTDGSDWITAAKIDGAGNSTSALKYNFSDHDPFPGTSYYRLKQTDFDGTESFSEAVAVRIKKISQLSIYPNPTKGDVIISNPEASTYHEAIHDVKFTLYDLTGRSTNMLFSEAEGEIHIDLSSFVKGIYLLEIEQEGIKSYHKIVLQD